MNEEKTMSKDELIKSLERLPAPAQLVYRQLYTPSDLGSTMSEVVESIPGDRFVWVVSRVKYALKRL